MFKKVIISIGVVFMNTVFAGGVSFVQFNKITESKPVIRGENIKVWSIKKDEHIRINLVEFSGVLGRHKHPDASHSLLVTEGELITRIDEETYHMSKGDFISIPQNSPHSYECKTDKCFFVSMDAPYYDSSKTIRLN